MAPETVVLDLPAWDCLPYDRISPNPEILARRMSTLATLASGFNGPFVLLTTLNAAMQRLPARAVMQTASFVARVGDRVDEQQLKGFLARMGFSPVSTVAEPGDFAIRGGIVDIYPPGDGGPVRLDFFGDVLDGARRFDPVTPAHHRKAESRRICANVRGDPGRCRDCAVPAELPRRIWRGRLG